ncbi:MAG: D-glycero-beta-D-manno-heptose 1-phosphate adenylyltransferase [Bacteroidales bacterium]|jgi:rfaE bifunctional protein nucleotidyltransferase chain/domain|nr:D-glycero-beta-D-manno-heptose 1-phosphate adenylyltransferase [Bacteroidales bacterium]
MTKLEIIQSKIIDSETLKHRLAFLRFMNKKIVFTNGCFDLLHLGHIEYLAQTRDLGDFLFVGLNSDDSVRRLKGEGRPVNSQYARAMVLASLISVGAVVIFDEDTPYELIKTIQPDVLVKGADYKPEKIVGYDIVKAKGGEIVSIDLVEGYSSTGMIDKI